MVYTSMCNVVALHSFNNISNIFNDSLPRWLFYYYGCFLGDEQSYTMTFKTEYEKI